MFVTLAKRRTNDGDVEFCSMCCISDKHGKFRTKCRNIKRKHRIKYLSPFLFSNNYNEMWGRRVAVGQRLNVNTAVVDSIPNFRLKNIKFSDNYNEILKHL